jgi:hypothetical protein
MDNIKIIKGIIAITISFSFLKERRAFNTLLSLFVFNP